MNISLDGNVGQITILGVSTNTRLERNHEYLYGSPSAKIAHAFLLFTNHVVGPILLAGIIAFEKRGGDPQKRNLINRLQSILFENVIIVTLMMGIVKLSRETFGLIDFSVMIWFECFAFIGFYNIILLFTEITIIQFMYIVVWKRVKGINDKFWSFYLNVTTTWVSSWIVLFEHTPPCVYSSYSKMNTANLEQSLQGYHCANHNHISIYFYR